LNGKAAYTPLCGKVKMTARCIGLAIALGSTLLFAGDFSLKQNGFGPITVHPTLTYEGKGEQLVATATNGSGNAIGARRCEPERAPFIVHVEQW
jgi:hypothetical protein